MKHCSCLMSDKYYMSVRHMQLLGKKIDWDNPKTYSEKLQWLKLYDRKPIYTTMVDKYEAKIFIASKVGEEYVIPTLGVWNHFDEIDFDKLPDQFVLKCNHDSGSTVICMDKSKLDLRVAKIKLETALGNNFYWKEREWPYKKVVRMIMAEPLLVDSLCPYLRDFKFYCFDGEPRVFYITSDKGSNLPIRQDFFDIEGNHIEMQDAYYRNNPKQAPDLPVNLGKMLELSRKLSEGTYHLRVDFYEIDNKVYCGELTFYEGAGFCSFTPDEYNYIMGDWIKLPRKK